MSCNKVVPYYFLIIFLIVASLTKSEAAATFISDTSVVNSILKGAKVSLDSNKIAEALRLSSLAYKESSGLDYVYGKAKSLAYIGSIQAITGSKDSSLITYKKAYLLFEQENNQFEVGNILNSIGNVFRNIGNQDTAEYYYSKALAVRKKVNDKLGIPQTIFNIGLVYSARGIYPKALEYLIYSLSLLEENGDKILLAKVLNNIGIVFWNQGNLAKALEYFFKSLKVKEEINDLKGAAYIYNNIGLIYQNSGDYLLALKYHNESLRIKQSQGDKRGMSYSFMNLGEIYQKQGDYDRALKSYLKAEEIDTEFSNLTNLADLYVNMGQLYRAMKNPIKSLEILKAAEKIINKIDNPRSLAACLNQIGLTNFDLGKKNEAINSCLLAIRQAQQIGALDVVKQGYENLSKMYERTGRVSQAFESYKMFITFRDSVDNIEKSKEIVKIQMQAEFDRLMQKQKDEQSQKLALIQGKSNKQTIVANVFILAFALTLCVFILLFIDFRQKQRTNDILAFQKFDMERQRSELMAQRDELEIQKNLVTHQRDKIMTMLTDLGESIDYARKIQQALLPSDKLLEKYLGNYFLFFKPRETVGGDFYWVAQNESLTFFAIADCTGHGVPGGFMSMLGVSLLNELNSRDDCNSPAKMLWNLRDLIIKALNQTGLDEDSQDGMDIALCMYNSQNHHLVYSGANLSVFIATSNPPLAENRVIIHDNIIELRPDRMPVAYYQRMDEFYEHHIVLNPGDTIYLFSDGYADQFGGPMNKKFGYTAFKNLLATAAKSPFDKQSGILWSKFDKWIGEENQTDDVTVMGIKIP